MTASAPVRLNRLRLAALLLAVACVLLPAGYQMPPQVLHRTDSGTQAYEETVWLDSVVDDMYWYHDFGYTGSGSFSGFLYHPRSSTLWLENTMQADVTLTLAGETVYSGTETEMIDLAGMPEVIPFDLTYEVPPDVSSRTRMGFMYQDVFGRLYPVPAWDYAPDADTDFNTLADVARLAFWIVSVGGLLLVVSSLRLSRRDWLILAGLLGLAVLVHLITLSEKLAYSDLLWTMETTYDNYVARGREWLGDYFGIPWQEAQQGNFIYLGILQRIIGVDLVTLYWFNTLAGSLVPVLLTLAGWGFFNRKTGTLTGLMAVFFMPMLHYQQTLQPAAPVILLVTLLIAAGYLLIKTPAPLYALACGVFIGLMMLLRGSMVLLLLWIPVILLAQNSQWRTKALYLTLSVVAFVLTLLPVLITNWNAGFYSLTPSSSGIQMIRANGIMSMGLNTHMATSEQLGRSRATYDWSGILREDIERDPLRLLELTLRRAGLHWQSIEHSDSGMIDYGAYSYNPSPTIQRLSLNGHITFRTLLLLATVSLIAAWLSRTYRQSVLVLVGGAVVYSLTMLPFYVLGRLRSGMMPFVLLLAAVSLVYIWQGRKQPRTWRRVLALSAVCVAVIAFTADWLVINMPRPQIIAESEIPADMVPVDSTFGDQIHLHGYAYYESDHKRRGYLLFELYWEARQAMDEDYMLILHFLDPSTDELIHQHNVRIGMESAPIWTTSRWNPGDLFFERYFVPLPDAAGLPPAYEIYAGVYLTESEKHLPVTQTKQPIWQDDVRLLAGSLQGVPETPETPPAAMIAWEDALSLTDAACEIVDDTVTLSLVWYVRERSTWNPQFFVHVYQADDLIAQSDSKLDEAIPMDAWLPGLVRETTHTLPEVSGDVTVNIGFYNLQTGVRRPVTFSTDALPVANDLVEIACPES